MDHRVFGLLEHKMFNAQGVQLQSHFSVVSIGLKSSGELSQILVGYGQNASRRVVEFS